MAQDERPGNHGRRHRYQRAPMPSVTMVLLKADGTAPSQTERDERRRYRLADVSAGNDPVTASAPAFAPVRHAGIHVGGGAKVTVDVRFAIAPFSQTLSVAAGPLVSGTANTSESGHDRCRLFAAFAIRSINTEPDESVPGIVNDSAYGGTTRSNRLTVSGVTSPRLPRRISAILHMNWFATPGDRRCWCRTRADHRRHRRLRSQERKRRVSALTGDSTTMPA